jgi:hypothetical protein
VQPELISMMGDTAFEKYDRFPRSDVLYLPVAAAHIPRYILVTQLENTFRVFHVTAPTVAAWLGRLEEEGPDALVQMRVPVNRFPDFVRYLVQRLKTLCPTMGKVKIAQTLARAGLHVAATTVGRMLKEDAAPKPQPEKNAPSTGRVVTAKYPNHVWHIDSRR